MLRRWRPADVPPLIDAIRASMPQLRPWMFWAVDFTDQVAVDFVNGSEQKWEQGEAYKYGLFDDAGATLGSVNLMARIGPGALELGYWVRTSHTGRGIAGRAARLVTSAGLALPQVGAVEAHIDRANAASARMVQRIGFTLAGSRQTEITSPGQTGVTMVWRRNRNT